MTRTSPLYEILYPWTILDDYERNNPAYFLAECNEMSEQLFAEQLGWTE